jgi:hypothetical protein
VRREGFDIEILLRGATAASPLPAPASVEEGGNPERRQPTPEQI